MCGSVGLSADLLTVPVVRCLLLAEIFEKVNLVLLHTAFYYHHPTVLIWLKTIQKDVESQVIRPAILPLRSKQKTRKRKYYMVRKCGFLSLHIERNN